jgi:DNA-binding transcriptional MerR regulator
MSEYRVDDLARASGMSVRNIRAYQDRGLLPPPRREGRVGVYSEAHLARLRLIANLLERGYTFAHIQEFIEAWQRGHDVPDLLGLEEVLTSDWSDESPEYVTLDQLQTMFGAGSFTPEEIERAISLDLLISQGEDRYVMPSPRLIHAGVELSNAGIPLQLIFNISEALATDIDESARILVDAISEHIFGGDPEKWTLDEKEIPEISATIRRLRPMAQVAVDVYFNRAMERRVRQLLTEHVASSSHPQSELAVGEA